MNKLKALVVFCLMALLIFTSKAQSSFNNDLLLVSVSHVPKPSELQEILAKCNSSNAECISQWIMSNSRFKLNVNAWLREDFLENVSEGEIMQGIIDLEQILHQNKNSSLTSYYMDKYNGWKSLKNAKADFLNNLLSYQAMMKLMLNNPRFEELNMGSNNYVNKSFYLMLNRYPTEFEKISSIHMVEGTESVLFFRKGKGLGDYLDILLTNDSYVEYQLKYWYEKLMLNQLTSEELSIYLSDLDEMNCSSLDCILKLIISKNIIRE